ncbi:transient receptor potential cation channel subfamily A member 1 homolog isoform X2 [Lineus longissimus]|uniref:transient receptor potential cation channel subfamily A member 1 homolog isoform X2 n=1 Tax=Lineus longissimus TaxID=88925 RepID=UPI002B4D385D
MSEIAGMDESPVGKYRPTVTDALVTAPVEMATLVPAPGLIQGESLEKLNITLHQCARDGNPDIMRLLLDQMSQRQLKKKINKRDEDFQSPLHYAARYNHFGIVKLLVERGAVVNIEDEEKATPLHYAARYRRQKVPHVSDSLHDVNLIEGSRRSSKQTLEGDSPGTPKKDTPDGETSGCTSPRENLNSLPSSPSKQIQSIIRYLVKKAADVNHKDEYGLTPLHFAAMKGNEIAASELLGINNIDIEATDKQDMTALHLAATHNQPAVARLLIDMGAQLRCIDEELSTPLHLACMEGSEMIMKMLFEAGEKMDGWVTVSQMVTDQDMDQSTPLHKAVEGGHHAVAKECIERGADVNTCRGGWNTCLHLAAVTGDQDIVKLLLDNNARIDSLNDQQETALHRAAAFDQTDVCEVLLERGALVEKKNKDNFTPLLVAANKGHERTVKCLMRRRADVFAMDKNEKTAIYWAAAEDKLAALKMLLSHPTVILANLIDIGDRYGNTPLHVAAEKGYVRIVKCLLEHKAGKGLKNEDEQTPIHLASKFGRTNVIRELISANKLLVNDEDEDSNTPLHMAAQYGQVKAVKVLILNGANIQARNCSMWTPLDCAAAGGWYETMKVLLKNDCPVDPLDKSKTTPLHLASEKGHEPCVELLLEWNANVGLRDSDGMNCLDLAIDNNNKNVALAIINSQNWVDAMRNETLDPVTNFRDTPMRKLIRKMPEVAEQVFNRCCTPNHRNPENPKYQVIFDYEFLDDMYSCWKEIPDAASEADSVDEGAYNEDYQLKPDSTPYTQDTTTMKTNHPLKIMVTSKRKDLLAHPLVTALLRHKWNSYGRYFYYINLCFYLIFLTFLTMYIVLMVEIAPYKFANNPDIDKYNGTQCERVQQYRAAEGNPLKPMAYAEVCKYFIIIFTVLQILRELFQFFQARLNYLGWENTIEWLTHMTALLLVIDFEGCQRETGLRLAWQWQLGAIAVFWAWIDLVLFIRKVPTFGIYVVMFTDVLRTFTRFFPVFFLFIVAFALSFYTLLANQVPFRGFIPSLIKTSVMMTGDVAYDNIFNDMHASPVIDPSIQTWYEVATTIQFVIFLFVMVILIMNLLVGLAVDDIKGVQEQAVLQRLAMQVELALDVECFVPMFISRKFVVKSQKFKPNRQRNWIQKIFRIDKSLSARRIAEQLYQDTESTEQDKLSTQVENVENRVKHIEYMLKTLIKQSNIQFEAVDEEAEERFSW